MENYYPIPINCPKEGIPKELATNKVSEDFICPICLNIVFDFVACAQCRKLFCKKCIEQTLEKVSDSCPLCRKSPFNCSNEEELKHLFINIHLKCPNEFCDKIILYSEYITHLEMCTYRKYHCVNDGCDYENVLYNKIDMKIHSNECIHRIVSCRFCEKKMKKIELNEHINNKCTQLVNCNYCNKRMQKEYFLKVHKNGDDNDIQCLKNMVSYYYNQSVENYKQFQKWKSFSVNELEKIKKEHKEEINEYQEVINKLKEECNVLSNENENLNKEMLKWDDNFQNLHKSFLNRKRKIKNQNKK